MLLNLHIKNVALIKEASVDFSRGLNILSGETGAGKSMIIDSVNFVLGGRVSRDFLSTGESAASVAALFIADEKTKAALAEMGFDALEDGTLLLSRSLSSAGKSACKLNGRTVTATILSKLSEYLIDIHGQHEHQSLLNPALHLNIVDMFVDADTKLKIGALAGLYAEYSAVNKQLSSFLADESEKLMKIDMLQFQIEEITAAHLKAGEEEELSERKTRVTKREKILRLLEESLDDLYRSDLSASDLLSRAARNTSELAGIDDSVSWIADMLSECGAVLSEAVSGLKKYEDGFDEDDVDIDSIEERLNVIYKLKRKYGKNITEILNFLNEKIAELESIHNESGLAEELGALKQKLQAEMASLCEDISLARKAAAADLEKQIEHTLADLSMKNAQFSVHFVRKDECAADGFDKVEFFISPNLGEDLKSLSKIASGGEMSRVMLAIKTVATEGGIDTFIFDEIDQGVSGKTAQKVAEKLHAVSLGSQIICVTHLPQIAAMADTHLLIEKREQGDRTVTSVCELDREGEILEIARLLGGAKLTEATKKAASELKRFADEFKR